MFHNFISYYPDIILCLYIFGGLAFGSFIRHSKYSTTEAELQGKKKNFYLMVRGSLIFLFLHLVGLVFSTFLNSSAEPIYDSLGFFEFYQRAVTNELGSFFFRYDFFVVSLVIILNLCVLFYLLILLNYFSTTRLDTKYIFEVPLLIVTTFLGLKYFLLAYDLIVMIIALELASLCTVILLSLQLTTNKNVFPIESAIKYFLFNAVSVSFMLVAISGYYIYVQNFNLLDFSWQQLLNPYHQLLNYESILVLHLFFFFGYLMKLGAAPLHHWVPDVYEGAEFVLTAFLILVVSPALNFKFFIFIKLLLPIAEIYHISFLFFLVLGFFSMFIGVINGVTQTRIKRFLAYASINHFGFILISLGTPSFLGFFAALFYLFTYILTNMAFFSFILLTHHFNVTTFIYLNQLKSLLKYNYLIFGFFLIPLFSFAGFPPFAGFFGKLFVFASLMDFHKIGLSIAIVFYVVLNAYLYLRFIKIAVFEPAVLTFYVPVHFTSYKITTNYNLKKKIGSTWVLPFRLQTSFFLLFLLNLFLLFFIAFLPNVSLFCSQLVFNLFLFY